LVVKSYEGLNQEVLKRREVRAYRLWLLLRSLDSEGRGWVDFGKAQESFLRLGLSRRSFRDILRKGEGFWWTRVRGRIFYSGLEKVCLRLRVLPGRPVLIPLPKRLSEFRALLHASFFVKEKTISRRRLQELTGKSKTTLRRWEKLTGVKIQPNLGYSPKLLSKSSSSYRCIGYSEEGQPFWEVCLDGKARLTWQISNSYVVESERLERAPWGLARKVQRRIKPLVGGEGLWFRLYFRDPRSALRYQKKTGEAVYVWDGRTIPRPLGWRIRSFRLWSYVSREWQKMLPSIEVVV